MGRKLISARKIPEFSICLERRGVIWEYFWKSLYVFPRQVDQSSGMTDAESSQPAPRSKYSYNMLLFPFLLLHSICLLLSSNFLFASKFQHKSEVQFFCEFLSSLIANSDNVK